MKTTLTTNANQLDGRTVQPDRASRFASAPTCSLSQVVWVVSNSISGTDDQRQPYSYQYYDNLLGGVYTNRANGPRILATYEYDAEKRRRRKTMSSQETRHFTYSGWSLLCETLTTNHFPLTTYYVWGKDLSGTLDGAGGVGGLLATEVGGVWYFPLYDNNGNITDYVSETGEVVASYEYDAFGRTITQSGTMADAFPFRFSTKYYDAESGLYYYGYRYYSPELGRWLTRDPIEEDGGDNLYAFCGNNGICRHDYLGHVSRGSVDALKKRKGVCYIFTIKVDTVGYDYSSGEAFIKSMAKRASKKAEGVGHSWVRLEDVRYNIVSEGGHSGENGDRGKNGKITNSNFLTYAKGVAYLAFMPPTAPSPLKDIPEADPANPARWLWYIYEDGEWKRDSGGHTKVDSELSVSISKEQYDAIKAKIDAFDSDESLLRNYGLTGNQCTSTAASLADMAGVHIDPYVQLNIPSSATLDGHELRLWTDPKYSSIRFAIPEKMEQELKMWRGSGDYVYR